MSNPSFKSSKGEIFHGMMRRPESAKLIREAFASPLGSTSRQKIQKNFKIMSKLHSSYDGAGGPGVMADQTSYGQTPQETGPITVSNENSKGLIVFPRIPKSKIVYGKAAPEALALDGSGGPGDFSNLSISSLAGLQPQTGLPGFGSIPTFTSGPAIQRPNPVQTSSPLLTGYPSTLTASNAGTAVSPGARAFSLPNLYSLFTTPFTDPSRLTIPKNVTEAATGSIGKTYPALDNKSFSIGRDGKLVSSAPAYVPLKIPPQPIAPPPPPVQSQAGTTTTLGGGVPTPTGTDWSSILGGPKGVSGVAGAVSSGLSSLGSTGSNAVTQSGLSSGVQSGATAPNVAAGNIAATLGVPVTTNPFTSIQMADLMKAIATNEGFFSGASKVSAANNNPGNLKYVGQAGATQGGSAADGGTFAKFATMNDGWEALKNDLEAKKASGKYTTLEDLMNVYSPNSGAPTGGSTGGTPGTSSTLTGEAATAADYISRNLGAGQFVLDTMAKEGGSLNARAAANKKSIWEAYGIDELKDKELLLKNEVRDLPKDQADYIRSRDTYLKETDKAISDYLEYMESNNDTSDPAVKQQMNSHLNYLYTLRGRQNKTYVGYLNEAVTAHENKLKDTSDTLTQRLAEAEASLASTNAITQDEYNMRAAALNDMYTTLKNAPTEAYQMSILKSQSIQAEALAALDPASKINQMGLIEASGKLKGMVWDGKYVLPNVDLMQAIQRFPEISPQNIIDTYMMGVNNYMSASVEKDEVTGTGITTDKKNETAKMAIKQLAYLANANAPDPETGVGGDPVAYNGAKAAAFDVAGYLADGQSSRIIKDGKAPQLMEAVRELAPKGWLGGAKTPPTVDQFVKNVTERTGNPLDESIARAIYAVFQSIITGAQATGDVPAVPADTPSNAMNAFLYPSSSSENWTETSPYDMSNPYTAEEFAKVIGELYAMNAVSQAFSLQ